MLSLSPGYGDAGRESAAAVGMQRGQGVNWVEVGVGTQVSCKACFADMAATLNCSNLYVECVLIQPRVVSVLLGDGTDPCCPD